MKRGIIQYRGVQGQIPPQCTIIELSVEIPHWTIHLQFTLKTVPNDRLISHFLWLLELLENSSLVS